MKIFKAKQQRLLIVCCVIFITAIASFVFAKPSFEVAPQSEPTISAVSVAPATQDRGSGVVISATIVDVSGISYAKAEIKNAANVIVATVNLYDDGAHSDGAVGDNVFANSWMIPASFAAGNYGIFIVASDTFGHIYQSAVANANLTVTIPSCTPSKTCADYPGQCGTNLSNGCANVLDCSGSCVGPKICCSGSCQNPVCLNNGNCNDGNSCTTDICNNPNTCFASCSNSPIAACINGDGCCPAGCNSGNDSDCAACVPTCATGPACHTIPLVNASVTAAVCCGAGESCYECDVGYTWDGATCVSVGVLAVSITSPNNFDEFKENTSVAFTSSVNGGVSPYTFLWQYDDFSGNSGSMGSTSSVTKNNFIDTMGFGTMYQITLQVTDNIGDIATDNIIIFVYKPLQPPTIFSPSDGSVFGQLETISFTGFENGGTNPYSFTWTSSIDGNIGNAQSFDTFTLSAGVHIITLAVTDGFGDTATDNITITVTVPPSVEVIITSPEDKKVFNTGDPIVFDSLAAGGTAPYSYSWVSSLDGNIGNLQTFNKNDLSSGDHIITLTITDSVSATATASIDVYVPPDSFDWRDVNGQNWMTSVKCQGCGDCWAFASLGSMEAKYNIEQNNPNLDKDFSEEYLLDCFAFGSCSGGMVAVDFIKNTGVAEETCYPYVGSKSACPATCNDGSPINLWKAGYSKIMPSPFDNEADLKYGLIKHGPLYIEMDASPWTTTAKIDKDGCNISAGGGGAPDHAVVLVGYDDINQYWIVKNSYGAGPSLCSDGYESVEYGSILVGLNLWGNAYTENISL